ncbi:response regulator transcription factor [Actinomycetospora aeridis]|uniref:Response regulator transcription factor n=1 Tax=Actinomycetospora aeridis TaxID=3129231 RepID=A0ABU8MXJ4_9PSEU
MDGGSAETCVVHDERPQARRRLRMLVETVAGPEAVAVARDADDLLACLAESPRAIAVLGLAETEPTGLEVVRRVLSETPGTAVLVAGSGDAHAPAQQALAEGATGFLRWDAPRSMIRTLVRSLATSAAGEDLVPRPAVPAARGSVETAVAAREDGLHDVVVDLDAQRRLELSVREVQVLIGVSRGLTNADIGRRLYLSDHTVKSHTGHLFRKLGASDRAQAVSHAWRLGLFVPAPTRRAGA